MASAWQATLDGLFARTAVCLITKLVMSNGKKYLIRHLMWPGKMSYARAIGTIYAQVNNCYCVVIKCYTSRSLPVK